MLVCPHAAGVLLTAETGRSLFCRRTDNGLWSVPAGGIERGETARGAMLRELVEETGYRGKLSPPRVILIDGTFWLFHAWVPEEFPPLLNHEHDRACWAPPGAVPAPSYPSLRSSSADFASFSALA